MSDIKPSNKRVAELTTQLTFEYYEKYKHMPSKGFEFLHKRDTLIIDELIKELAFERAKNEILMIQLNEK